MHCPDCGVELVTFTVPREFRDHLPGSESAAGLCPHCLALEPVGEPVDTEPEFGRVSDTFPGETDAALPMALLVGLLSNLALYRAEISELLEAVERAGVDPLLVLDRLDHDPSIETDTDLVGRRRQLEQLL